MAQRSTEDEITLVAIGNDIRLKEEQKVDHKSYSTLAFPSISLLIHANTHGSTFIFAFLSVYLSLRKRLAAWEKSDTGK